MFRATLLATALLLPACTAATGPGLAQAAQSEPSVLSLSATGEVQVEPDLAIVSAGAVTRGDTASEALAENAEMMTRVFQALDRAGIDDEDRQTSSLSVNPVYEQHREGGVSGSTSRSVIVGYEARNVVTAHVRDLDNIGATIDALVSNGANQLNGLSFTREDTEDAQNEARLRAISELNTLRDLYASTAGFEVVRLKSLSEGGGYAQPVAMMEAASFSRARTPVAAGSLTVSVTVNASWEIED